MQIVGVVEIVKYESNPPKRKIKIADLMNSNCSWWVEFRKELKHKADVLKQGDHIRVEAYNEARESSNNTHNNMIAKTLERL